MKSSTLIVTHRLQTLHLGHISYWQNLCRHFSRPLIVCVLRDVPPHCNTRSHSTKYEKLGEWTLNQENNPLPESLRLELADIAVRHNPLLHRRVRISLRNHPIVNWENSLQGLPSNRVWVFNKTKSEFDSSKTSYYNSKGEKVLVVAFGDYGFSGKLIRKRLRSGRVDLSFLPRECRDFFLNMCLQYFFRKE